MAAGRRDRGWTVFRLPTGWTVFHLPSTPKVSGAVRFTTLGRDLKRRRRTVLPRHGRARATPLTSPEEQPPPPAAVNRALTAGITMTPGNQDHKTQTLFAVSPSCAACRPLGSLDHACRHGDKAVRHSAADDSRLRTLVHGGPASKERTITAIAVAVLPGVRLNFGTEFTAIYP
ncbi:hypothetical protein C2845_PM12G26530 [Panicum miliaceum]|uniref:Uncharacterized protein n=1 Tax=Panicum miliaceum TaxID=4540 RepID=A0A3L6QIM5_PANMI|nr:hypothetical protein C2845_PM12G26530 [Panicum miliaceum]